MGAQLVVLLGFYVAEVEEDIVDVSEQLLELVLFLHFPLFDMYFPGANIGSLGLNPIKDIRIPLLQLLFDVKAPYSLEEIIQHIFLPTIFIQVNEVDQAAQADAHLRSREGYRLLVIALVDLWDGHLYQTLSFLEAQTFQE